MKQLITLLFIIAPIVAMAQNTTTQDTTIYVGNRKFVVKENDGKLRIKVFEETATGDTIKNDQIFEGVYRDGQSTEQRLSVSVPFVKKKTRNNQRWHFDPHSAGVYMGYYQMGDEFMDLSNTDKADLVASKSWEWGINLFDGALRLSKHFGFTGGLGFGYTSYRLGSNQAFIENSDGVTHIVSESPEDVVYKNSRLRYYHLRLPITFEFQQRFGWRGPLFFSIGAEAEARLWVKSIAKVNGKKRTLGKDMNVRPLGINILAQAGYSDWGLYFRYSTASLFEKNKGPELYPYSVGIKWYW